MSSSTQLRTSLKGWHPGEVTIQSIINLREQVGFRAIVNRLPEQHRLFHTTRLYFLPTTTLDKQDRPWASLLCSKDGLPNFIHSLSDTRLVIEARVWDGEPIIENLRDWEEWSGKKKALVSAVGLETSTRRRNKFAGHVENVTLNGRDLSLSLDIEMALGLCPKYINVRQVVPHPNTRPRLVHRRINMDPGERLPGDVIEFIHSADSAYLATHYVPAPKDEEIHPPRVGTNHRGGRPGFVRVRPSDGRTLVLPNYAGNRTMNSLGNIHVTPVAGMVFPSFTDGSVLYVTGVAETLFGKSAQDLMPHQNIVTTIRVTGFIFVSDVLPIREDPQTSAERSPYNPPVRYLAEEKPPEVSYEDVLATLRCVRVHNDTLTTYNFETSRPVEIRPIQTVVFDLTEFTRSRSHQLLSWEESPQTENDDCVRTWTVSVLPTAERPTWFSITARAIKGGLVTPLMQRIAEDATKGRKGEEVDVSDLGVTVRLRGIGGELPAPEPVPACDGGRKLLWLAGGIGLTPFLSLTRYVAELVAKTYGVWDIVLVLSTKEPEVMLELIAEGLEASLKTVSGPPDLTYVIHLFSPRSIASNPLPKYVRLYTHTGRVPEDGAFFKSVDAVGRESHICGPLPFVQSVTMALGHAGVEPERVRRERFTF